MPHNKNQHFIPKCYFKLFSKNEKTICVFNLKNKRFIEFATIKGQCSKNCFYGKNIDLEKSLSHLEGLILFLLIRSLKE